MRERIVWCATCEQELVVESISPDGTGPWLGKPCPCGKGEGILWEKPDA